MFDEVVLNSIRALGVQMQGGSDKEIVQCIQSFMPEGDFLQLAISLDSVSKKFGFSWEQAEWHISDGRHNGVLLNLEYKTVFGKKEELLLQRRINNQDGHLIAHHDWLGLPVILQRKNISRIINGALYILYRAVEVRTIETYAGLDVGGYAWAKAGFAAVDRDEIEDVLNRAKRLSLQPPAVIDALSRQVDRHYAQNPNQPFPIWEWGSTISLKEMLMGSLWHGELNLYNQQQVARFEEYLKPKP